MSYCLQQTVRVGSTMYINIDIYSFGVHLQCSASSDLFPFKMAFLQKMVMFFLQLRWPHCIIAYKMSLKDGVELVTNPTNKDEGFTAVTWTSRGEALQTHLSLKETLLLIIINRLMSGFNRGTYGNVLLKPASGNFCFCHFSVGLTFSAQEFAACSSHKLA